ncbi:Aste57867_19256 [Aphanomyces stellatus]|uniref:Aste57867_19256 protein n=1 Tax=Aphanomyces stellatus TaxID=120398 RepID=A0A485LDU2_9STRA|nr:hypothetical protein As57867_019192 [Aphanomyces stellatus]VFT95976.1 Aste57867_19256 [Aphanomyces stellatus]
MTKSAHAQKSPSGRDLPRVNRPGKLSLSEESAGFHWWPLPIALSMVFAIFYMGNILYHSGWLDKLTGGLVSTQFNEENILTGGCGAINHAITWRELSRKAIHCSRGNFFDPLHNRCAACLPLTPDDKFLAVSWNTKVNCSKLVEESETRFISHVYWSFASVDASGAVVPPKDQQDNTALSKCMMQLRTRCIRQIGVIGDISASTSMFASLSDATIPTFVASAVKFATSYGLDGLNIADPTGNSASGKWARGDATVAYMKALRAGLDAAVLAGTPPYTLSWDEYPNAFDKSTNATSCNGLNANSRCFPAGLDAVVDTIQLQMGFRSTSTNLSAITGTNWTAIIPRLNEKVMYGMCNYGSACVFTDKELKQMAFDGTYIGKGAAIYSGNVDITTNGAKTLSTMGALGAYGILMPTQLVDMPILPY